MADVPVGCLLSGGVDSSLIVGLLAEAGQHGLATFSIGFESVGGVVGDEFRYSDIIAERFDKVGRVRRAAHMTDRDPAARRGAERGLVRLGVEARQFVLDRPQGFEHLDGQKILGPPLRLGNRQHARGTGAEGAMFQAAEDHGRPGRI